MPVKFHASLNVADLARSVEFYRKFLGREPARQKADYAKFEIDEPPLVLSLIPGRANPGGSLNHFGLRLADSAALLELQARLETVGISTKREEGVQCCHSTQTKFWVTDPDRTLWELYILHDGKDEDHDDAASHAGNGGNQTAVQEKIVWQHQIPEPFPARIPHEDNSVHAVMLEGTFNMRPELISYDKVLAEACRVLRPGGELSIHGLAGDQPCHTTPLMLPGPAAAVQYVPEEMEPMQAMIRAGFLQVRFEKLSPKPFFIIEGVQMREILLVGRKPGHRPRIARHHAIYLGPLAQVTDDGGNVFPRGERVALNIHDWQQLSQSVAASQFLFLSPKE